jgi:hypothetical protein
MTRIDQSVWEALLSDPPSGQQIHSRLAIPELSERVYCAIDAERRRHLLVVSDGLDDSFDDRQSRGISVVTRELLTNDGGCTQYIDLVCQDPRGHSFLDLVGGALAESVRRKGEPGAPAVRQEIAKWRRFWGSAPSEMLSVEEQLGLFAELWFIAFWVMPFVDALEAVRRWTGPLGARHDFEWLSRAVEVKATCSQVGRIHRINGLDQLVPPTGGELYLYSLKLRQTSTATNCLPTIVSYCLSLLKSDIDATTAFETSLLHAGYDSRHADSYKSLTLEVVNELLFPVCGEFPRLVPEFVACPGLGAIERLEYDINLAAYERLAVQTRQSAGELLI